MTTFNGFTYVAHTSTGWTYVRALVTNTADIDIHNNLRAHYMVNASFAQKMKV